jgi:predicted dehydrogenase
MHKRILIVGCGSIGHRHIRALLSLGMDNIGALRTRRGQVKNLAQDIQPLVKTFANEKEAYEWQPTHMVISNPTSLHIRFVIKAMELNIPYFVEKPLCANMNEIINISGVKISNGVVGYNLRFHGLFAKIKDVLSSGKYGDMISASLSVGHYLPFWHSEQDYSARYEARKDLGGGVLRTLSHEIDLAQYYFGRITKLYAKVEKLSKLKLDVDDNVDIIAKTEHGVRVKIHLDYLNPVPERFGRILFEHGLMEYDFINSNIFFTDYDNKKRLCLYSEKENYDTQYITQMDHFINGITEKACTISQEIHNMNVIEASETASERNVELCLD